MGLTFLPLVDQIGEGYSFWILGGFCMLAFVFIYKRVPETMNRSLEEIESDLRANTTVGADSNRPD